MKYEDEEAEAITLLVKPTVALNESPAVAITEEALHYQVALPRAPATAFGCVCYLGRGRSLSYSRTYELTVDCPGHAIPRPTRWWSFASRCWPRAAPPLRASGGRGRPGRAATAANVTPKPGARQREKRQRQRERRRRMRSRAERVGG